MGMDTSKLLATVFILNLMVGLAFTVYTDNTTRENTTNQLFNGMVSNADNLEDQLGNTRADGIPDLTKIIKDSGIDTGDSYAESRVNPGAIYTFITGVMASVVFPYATISAMLPVASNPVEVIAIWMLFLVVVIINFRLYKRIVDILLFRLPN